MSPTEKRRLEKLETFVERLTLGSYVAKAAATGGKVLGVPLSAGDHNLARAATGTPDYTAAGEATLAKAVGAFSDPEALLAYADRTISDPTVIGVVSGHISAGDMQSAKEAVLEAVQRGSVAAKAADIAGAVGQATGAGSDDDLASFDSRRAVSEMTERFGSMERLLASLEARLTQLERRPQAAPVAPQPQTVAKAAGPKRPKTAEETAESLLAQIDAYIDSPSVVGQLSSMVHAGKFAEVRRVLAGAKRSHDAQRLVQEHKSWGG